MKIFLSYASKNQESAKVVASLLKRRGVDVWLDKGELRPGELWRESIAQSILSSVAVVVLLTPESVNSPFVTFEWSYALGSGTRIIPLLFKPVDKVHPSLEALVRLDFSNPRSRRWNKLCDEIHHSGSANAGRFLVENFPPTYEKDFHESEDLCLIGVSLRETVKNLGPVLAKKVQSGSTVRALLCEPLPAVVEAAARRIPCPTTRLNDDVRAKCQEIERSIQRLLDLRRRTGGRNALEIRSTRYPLGYGIHGMNTKSPGSGNVVLYVRLYPYKLEQQFKPTFVLRKGHDFWYERFASEMEALWKDGIAR